eukprot:7530868-Karenia_brevis.AAC.1
MSARQLYLSAGWQDSLMTYMMLFAVPHVMLLMLLLPGGIPSGHGPRMMHFPRIRLLVLWSGL